MTILIEEKMTEILGQLNASFDNLDRTLEHVKFTLTVKSNVPAELINRIYNYKEIVQKQRNLAKKIPELLTQEKKDMPGVSRILNIINQLTAMIKTDILEVQNIIIESQNNGTI